MDYRVKSGARAVHVLEFFHRYGAPSRAIDIGRALDISPSSTNDLLKTLVEVGYLEFNDVDKTYFIGARAALFGHWAAVALPELARLQDLARLLRERTGECIVLSTRRGPMVQFLSIMHGPDRTPSTVAEGLSAPMVGTAAGSAILMDMKRADVSTIVKKTYHLKKVDQVVETLTGRLKTFKERGYASPVTENFLPENWVVALPVRCRDSAAQIAVGIGGPKSRIQERERDLAVIGRETITRFFATPPSAA